MKLTNLWLEEKYNGVIFFFVLNAKEIYTTTTTITKEGELGQPQSSWSSDKLSTII